VLDRNRAIARIVPYDAKRRPLTIRSRRPDVALATAARACGLAVVGGS